MAQLPDNVHIDLSSKAKPSRGFVATTIFERVQKADNTWVSVAKVTEEDVPAIRRFWFLPSIEVGQRIILEPNGDLTVLSEDDFQQFINE